MEIDSLRKLFVEELKDLHSAERQLIQALPRMAKKASNGQLRSAFELHLEETRRQVERLDQIFEKLGKKGMGKKCKGMEGLIEEAKEMMGEDMEPEVMDAALISAAQRVEHYEIAGYGTVRTYAELLGFTEAVRLLERTLQEEEAADELLTQIAESSINAEALTR